MQVVVNDLLVSYQRVGKGPTVVMLHGWADDLRTFGELVKVLEGKYQLVRLDLPGFGGSDAPKSVWDLTDYAEHVRDFLNKLELSSYAFVGHSNGGAIAIRGLANGVLKADKLVLIASAGVRNDQNLKKQSLKLVAKTGKLVTYVLPKSSSKALKQKFYKHIGSDLLIAPHLEETFKRVVTQDVQSDAKKLDLPTMLIYGQKDTATPYDRVGSRLHKSISGSKLSLIPEADHFVHQNQADQVAYTIAEFLA